MRNLKYAAVKLPGSNCPIILADVGEIADVSVQLSVSPQVSALTNGYPCKIIRACADILVYQCLHEYPHDLARISLHKARISTRNQ